MDAAVIRAGKSSDSAGMTILPRLIAIAIKKYTSRPNEREPAVRMLLRNAIRLSVAHLGREQTQALALETLQEPSR